jgi:hypothetical protein
MQYEGTGGTRGENRIPLQLWLKSTRRYLENTTADDTNVMLWAIMELPVGTVYTEVQTRRDNAAKDAILTHLSPIMYSMVERLDHAADMWRRLVQVQ